MLNLKVLLTFGMIVGKINKKRDLKFKKIIFLMEIKISIPQTSLCEKLIQELHVGGLEEHLSHRKTLQMIS